MNTTKDTMSFFDRLRGHGRPGHHGHRGDAPVRHPHDAFHPAAHDLHALHAMRRGGRGGFAGFTGFGRDDPFSGGMGGLMRGRKLSSDDLQLLLLALLAERASHGYELIKAIAERSAGFYAPSPGMVYPALTWLEEVGYAAVEADGARKLYRITEAGLTQLEAKRAEADALIGQLAWIGQRLEKMRAWMAAGEHAFGPDAAGDFEAPPDAANPRGLDARGRGRHRAGIDEVRAARRKLKTALVEKYGASVDEQKRIAAILDRAADEIRGQSSDQT